MAEKGHLRPAGGCHSRGEALYFNQELYSPKRANSVSIRSMEASALILREGERPLCSLETVAVGREETADMEGLRKDERRHFKIREEY